jgi:dihydroflavonol-4-reductase
LPGAAERLELVEADLTRSGSFDAPATGCAAVMHTASPYVLDVRDPERDLVTPAVEGTRSVLTACARSGSVTRVVLTSSMAAITDEPEPDRVLTEADWNVKSSLQRNPYYYSKTLAERAAWSFVEKSRQPFDLVVINPFMVIGPSLVPSLNTSTELFVALANGTFPGILSMAWAIVDVRDVAEAHLRAMERPEAHGRYICAGEVVTMRDLVDLLRRNGYGRYRLPTRSLESRFGTWLAWLASYTRGKGTGTYLRTHLGRVPRYDNTKIRTELGMTFRPAAESILDTMADLEQWGHLPPART